MLPCTLVCEKCVRRVRLRHRPRTELRPGGGLPVESSRRAGRPSPPLASPDIRARIRRFTELISSGARFAICSGLHAVTHRRSCRRGLLRPSTQMPAALRPAFRPVAGSVRPAASGHTRGPLVGHRLRRLGTPCHQLRLPLCDRGPIHGNPARANPGNTSASQTKTTSQRAFYPGEDVWLSYGWDTDWGLLRLPTLSGCVRQVTPRAGLFRTVRSCLIPRRPTAPVCFTFLMFGEMLVLPRRSIGCTPERLKRLMCPSAPRCGSWPLPNWRTPAPLPWTNGAW